MRISDGKAVAPRGPTCSTATACGQRTGARDGACEQLQVAARRARPGRGGGAATLGSDNLCHIFLFYAPLNGPRPGSIAAHRTIRTRAERCDSIRIYDSRLAVPWGRFLRRHNRPGEAGGRAASRISHGDAQTHRRCDQRRPKRRGTPRKTSLLAGPCARLVRALCPVRSCLRSCTPLHHAS